MSDKQQYEPLSFSSLKAFSRSPLAFLDYKNGVRKETAAMRFGTLVHRAILEPERYATTTEVWEGARRGAAYKDFVEAHPGMDILTSKEAIDIRILSDRVLNHTYAGEMIAQCTRTELPFQIMQCDIPHRGIIDGLGKWFMLDLKTTMNVSHWSLQRTIYDMKYYMQAAIYQRAAELMGIDAQTYFIVAVENSAPHHVQVVELEPHYIARGHMEWEKLLNMYKAWDGEIKHNHESEEGWMMDAPGYAPTMDFGI